jgi:hypothetical protein
VELLDQHPGMRQAVESAAGRLEAEDSELSSLTWRHRRFRAGHRLDHTREPVFTDELAQPIQISHYSGSCCVDAGFAKPGPHGVLVVHQRHGARPRDTVLQARHAVGGRARRMHAKAQHVFEPVPVGRVPTADHVVEGVAQLLGDRSAAGCRHRAVIDRGHRDDLSGGSGEERLVGKVELTAGQAVFPDREARSRASVMAVFRVMPGRARLG